MFLADVLLKRLPNFFELTAGMTVSLAIRYALFAGGAWLLCYVFFKRRWIHRKIIARFPDSSEVRREIAYSAISVVIFATMGSATLYAARQGWTQLYWRIDKYGWSWFWLSIGAAVLLHDTYFYWTHRLMHHRRLFRYFHRVHHLSHNPTPWAAYAFDPLEAVVQAAIFPLAVIVMPMHPFAFAVFMLWQISFNIIGHAGYEHNRRTFMDSWLKHILNTPTNHIMHHEKMRGNYGLYFAFWDRLMGTNHEDYEARFREVTSREAVRDKGPVPATSVETKNSPETQHA
ncbi:sterol desaturase family protein [Verrucomicrobiota bacterium sgz303538]